MQLFFLCSDDIISYLCNNATKDKLCSHTYVRKIVKMHGVTTDRGIVPQWVILEFRGEYF